MQRKIPKSVLSAVTQMLVPGTSPADAKKVEQLDYTFPPTRPLVSGRGQVVHYAAKDEYNPKTETTIIELSETKQYIYGRNCLLQFDIINNSTDLVLHTGHLSSFINAIRILTIRSKTGVELERVERLNLLTRYRLLMETSNEWLKSAGKRLLGFDQGILPTKSAVVQIPLYLISGLFSTCQLMPPELISGARVEIEWEDVNTAWQWSGKPDTATYSGGFFTSPAGETVRGFSSLNITETAGAGQDFTFTGTTTATIDAGVVGAENNYYLAGDRIRLDSSTAAGALIAEVQTVDEAKFARAYTIRNPRVFADHYTLHPSVIKELQTRASRDGLMFTFETYTNDRFHRKTSKVTLASKESLSRACRVFTIARLTDQVANVTDDSFGGGTDQPAFVTKQFRYRIGNNYYPIQSIKEKDATAFDTTAGNQTYAELLYSCDRLDDTKFGFYTSDDGLSLFSARIGGIPMSARLDLSSSVEGTGVPISAQRQLVLDIEVEDTAPRVYDVFIQHTKAVKVGSTKQLVRV